MSGAFLKLRRTFDERAGIEIGSHPAHATPGRTLRHWTIDSREFVGGPVLAAPAMPYWEKHGGPASSQLASKLARVKANLARPVN